MKKPPAMDVHTWDLFTCKEEYATRITDQFGRFPFFLSHHDVFRPQVSEFLCESGSNITYPDNKPFAVCLTHDIDFLNSEGTWQRVVKALLKGNFQQALRTSMEKRSKQWNPLLNFPAIMDIEAKYGAKSTFFFRAGDETEIDFNYHVEDFASEIGTILDNEHEIGLHGSLKAHCNLELIQIEKKRLEKVVGGDVAGYRNHFLGFKIPITWELLHEAGFLYDATFGYSECIGFRNGMCHPFKPFNLLTEQEINILEIPLHVMDTSLIFMKTDPVNTYTLIRQLVDTCEKYHGVLTISWHNNAKNDWINLDLYKKIVQYCYEKGAWLASGEQILKFWNDVGN